MSDSNKIVKLSSVAEIRQGFTFRERVAEDPQGNAHLVQIKDVREAGQWDLSMQLRPESLPKMDWQGKDQAKIVDDCVLLPCRGEYLKAHYLKMEERSEYLIGRALSIWAAPVTEYKPEEKQLDRSKKAPHHWNTSGDGESFNF